MEKHREEPAIGGSRLPLEIGYEHPAGAGYDRTGHRDSSVVEIPRRPEPNLWWWTLGFMVALLAIAALIGWMVGK
jgi:hypothetical protein